MPILKSGSIVGSYEVLSSIGAGGMGEVYRARDSRLKRDVAIKVLPEAFSQDTQRVARFQREAEVLASLNHPNIAQIYGLEEAGGSRCLVLEFVDGESLQARIRRGAVPVGEAMEIARQIAAALEAAHEKGIVHRDLKPGNVMLTGDGGVKVLDFGLAKAAEGHAGSATSTLLSNSPTIGGSIGATGAGMILGTAAYMSPEQARGRTVDPRTDVFAFGCVLYEMLTGRPAFDGDDVADILSRVLQREPDHTLLPGNVPPRVRELLRLCLEKNVKNRRQTAADVRIDIDQALAPVAEAATLPPPARVSRAGWVVAGLIALAALALAIPAIRHLQEPTPAELRVDINTPATSDLLSMAISPDGQRIVFVANDDGQMRIWLRSMASQEATALMGTDGASFPFWSPNSRSIGFFADGKLKRLDIAGGTVQTIADAAAGRGGTWSGEDIILFADSVTGPISRVLATGGQPTAATRMQAHQSSHRFPRFLPDNRHFFYIVSGEGTGSVYVGSIDGSEKDEPEQDKLLFVSETAAEFAPSGHVFFGRQGTLFAQRFNDKELELVGDPFPVAENIAIDRGVGVAAVTASAAGPIAFRISGGAQQFVWFDRSGREVRSVGPTDTTIPSSPDISPDGRRLVFWRAVHGNPDAWIVELERDLLSRFTVDEATDIEPIWSADGETIIFASNRKGTYQLYRKPVNGSGTEELLLETPYSKRPQDVSPDGHFLLYGSIEPSTAFDLLAMPLMGEKKPIPIATTKFEERDGQFSPSGDWIAYRSNESGRSEVYVQPFPGGGEKKQVSTNGGQQPRWSPDGKELFYIGPDSRLMVVPIRAVANSRSIEPGAPAELFATRIALAPQRTVRHQYEVSHDGKQFLINSFTKDAAVSPITLILNWNPQERK